MNWSSVSGFIFVGWPVQLVPANPHAPGLNDSVKTSISVDCVADDTGSPIPVRSQYRVGLLVAGEADGVRFNFP